MISVKKLESYSLFIFIKIGQEMMFGDIQI